MRLADRLDSLLRHLGVPDGDPDTPLDLESLQVLTLVDLLEDALDEHGVLLGSADVTRAHFATRASLLAMLRDRGIPCD